MPLQLTIEELPSNILLEDWRHLLDRQVFEAEKTIRNQPNTKVELSQSYTLTELTDAKHKTPGLPWIYRIYHVSRPQLSWYTGRVRGGGTQTLAGRIQQHTHSSKARSLPYLATASDPVKSATQYIDFHRAWREKKLAHYASPDAAAKAFGLNQSPLTYDRSGSLQKPADAHDESVVIDNVIQSLGASKFRLRAGVPMTRPDSSKPWRPASPAMAASIEKYQQASGASRGNSNANDRYA